MKNKSPDSWVTAGKTGSLQEYQILRTLNPFAKSLFKTIIRELMIK